MDLVQKNCLLKQLKNMHLEVLVLETYILVLRGSVENVMERIRSIEKY